MEGVAGALAILQISNTVAAAFFVHLAGADGLAKVFDSSGAVWDCDDGDRPFPGQRPLRGREASATRRRRRRASRGRCCGQPSSVVQAAVVAANAASRTPPAFYGEKRAAGIHRRGDHGGLEGAPGIPAIQRYSRHRPGPRPRRKGDSQRAPTAWVVPRGCCCSHLLSPATHQQLNRVSLFAAAGPGAADGPVQTRRLVLG